MALVPLRVAGGDPPDVGEQVRLDVRGVAGGGGRGRTRGGVGDVLGGHQRYTPPRTGSMEAKEGTRSAIMPPSPIIASDCRLEKMNAGGVLNTCKSSEKLNSETSVEHLSGKRRTY